MTRFQTDGHGSNAVDVVPGADGSVWVALFNDKKVVRLDRAGVVVVTTALSGGPVTLEPDRAGGIWLTEFTLNKIAHVDATGVLAEYTIPTPNSYPAGLYETADYVYFTESAVGQLGRLDKNTGSFAEFSAGMSSPWDITGKPLGLSGQVILVTDSNGVASAFDERLDHPTNVGFDGVKSLELLGGPVSLGIALWDDHVDLFTAEGSPIGQHLVLGHRGELVGARPLWDNVQDADLWFVDAGTNSIGTVSRSGTVEFALPAGWSSAGLAVTEGEYIWTVDRASGDVIRFAARVGAVGRLGGADRFEVATNVSSALHDRPSVVFIASGENFPDALSVGPLAAAANASLLLTRRDELPTATRTELSRIGPLRVVVVGGVASVSVAVVQSISDILPKARVDRVEGPDRYAVSRALLASEFGPRHASVLYVASGENFPDALSSTAAAATSHAGILLVNGSSGTLGPDDMKLIGAYSGSGKTVKIAGGPLSVSAGIESQIAKVAVVTRLGGLDRYAVSLAVVRDVFPLMGVTSSIYIASGITFSDALAGGVLAGRQSSPVILSRGDCIPAAARSWIAQSPRFDKTLLGGINTLSPAVEQLTACS